MVTVFNIQYENHGKGFWKELKRSGLGGGGSGGGVGGELIITGQV